METRDYVTALRRRWWLIVLVAILGAVSGWGLSRLVTPTYTASAQVYVSLTHGTTAADLANGGNYTQQQIASYAQLTTTAIVLNPVIAALQLKTTAADLAKNLDVTTPVNTTIMEISAMDSSPDRAADIANAVATQAGKVIEQVSPKGPGGSTSVTAHSVQDAVPPVAPSSPKTGLNTILGAFIGLLGALIFVLLRAAFNTRVGDKTNVEQLTGAPLLGIVPQYRKRSSSLIMLTSPTGPEAESYRKLRTDLQFVAVDRSSLTMAVTSSIAREGKSTTVCNLALAMTETGARVLLIDGDLRKPKVARLLSLEGAAGLTTVLAGKANFAAVVQRWGDTELDILTSGVIPPNPSELLSSHRMADLLASLREQYDMILIDTPPTLPVADSAILARLSDGILMLVDVTSARVPQVHSAAESLASAGAHILGTVLNRTSAVGDVYTYASSPQSSVRPKREMHREEPNDSELQERTLR